jgi:DNA-binding transcriptional LysR family regulator
MRYPDLDIDLLRCFVTVAERGGFTAAGEHLGRSQSAVSLKVKRLEELLGGKRILERTSRSLALTDEGELLLGYARRILELNDETVRRIGAPPAEGQLRFGIAEYFVPQHLPGILAAYARRQPKVRIEVRVGTTAALTAALDAGELDLVVGKRDPSDPRGRLVGREPLVWVAAEGFSIDAAQPLPLLVLPAPCSYRQAALGALEAGGRTWRVVLTSASIMGVQAAVTAGLGLAALGRGSVLPGMRVAGSREGLPALPCCEVVVIGELAAGSLAAPLVEMIVEALQAPARAA